MIADNSDEFRQTLETALSNAFNIVQCSNGKQALEMALETKPEIIILDLMLTELDGISLLYEIRNAGLESMVLAVTRFFNDYVQEIAQELGISYIIRKPCDPNAVCQRVKDLVKRQNPAPAKSIDPRNYIIEKLRELMFSPKHQGTKYLQEAVLIAMGEPDISLTKDLYPRLGRHFSGTGLQVEHAIRTAISAAYRQSCGQIWDDLFPSHPINGTRQLSNGVVIARLAEELRMKTNTGKDKGDDESSVRIL